VHCTASDREEDDDIEVIRKWHLARGFVDVGYHYMIHKDGSVSKGRSLNVVGAHTEGRNTLSVGIVLAGLEEFSPSQFIKLGMLRKEIEQHYGRELKFYPHNYFANKLCPNFPCDLWDKKPVS
jgi:hypothetical protein